METKRIFVAIKIRNTEQIHKIFRKLQVDLRDEYVKWVDVNGIHVTLAFIGNVDTCRIELITNCLENCAAKFSGFDLQIKSLGVFPNINKARVLWFGVDTSEQIFEIRNEIVKQLDNIVEIADKRFHPHLTIGRIKKVIKNPEYFNEIIQNYSNWEDEKLHVSEFSLMESKLSSKGPNYVVLKNFRLSN